MADKISIPDIKEFGFLSKRNKLKLAVHKKVLYDYKKGFDEAIGLNGDSLIFLDANFLIKTYKISFKAREKIKQFLKDYKNRIVITNQVQIEFIRNRENNIKKFIQGLTQKLPQTFETSIINTLEKFKNENTIVLKDYSEVEDDLSKLIESAALLLEKLKEKVEDKKNYDKELLYNDEFLDILCELNILDALPNQTIEELKKQFKECLTNNENSDILKEPQKAFPGSGDIKEKADPTGDYIIFHEILQHSAQEKKDAIFLTYDITKGDWMQMDKSAHLHYVENFYQNTEQLIYILDAQWLFETLYDISFKSIVSEPPTKLKVLINYDNLQEFISNCPILQNITPNYALGTVTNLADELSHNGIYFLDDLEGILNDNIFAKEAILKKWDLNRIGFIRVTLQLLYPDYVFKNGVGNQSQGFLEFKKKLLNIKLGLK